MGTWADVDGVVDLPDGVRIRGTGLRRRRDAAVPEFGVYLLGRDPRLTDREYRWIRWPDFRLPASTEELVTALREAHERARTERVEIACGGGVGRTGSALAVLAAMSGVPTNDAVGWVRAHYHRRAVETRRQRQWVEETARLL